MANYQLHDVVNPSTGLTESKNIEYMNGGGSNFTPGASGYPIAVENSLGLFLMGGTGYDGKSYPKVDMSLWDQATMCGTCHVGGPFYEQDRQGSRLPARLFADWGAAMTGTGMPKINPLTTTVWESFDPTTGLQTSKPTFAPWIMPMFTNNDPVNGTPITAPNGMGPDVTGSPIANALGGIDMPDPNTGAMYHLAPKQLMMPNVKEMDCLFCHMKGYNNVMASVMTQAGNLAYAPTAGAGLMNTMTQSYDSPYAALGTATADGIPVSLSAAALANLKGAPDSDNCMQCHATRTLKDLPEMFGTTGTSNGFLSSAPMVYDPAYGNGPLGRRMVSYDINSALLFPGQTSPVITMSGLMAGEGMMPDMPFPQAMGVSLYNNLNPALGEIGGGNAGHSGPLMYSSTAGSTDQKTMKLSTMPFPRAEWFKRGDAWQAGKDLHGALGCAGCHFTGDTTHKNQCDPGRGFDMMSGIQDGVPPLKNRNLVTEDQGEGTPTLQTPEKHDTRNTVKRCEFCHITGKDYFGQTINTFGAPNPSAKHEQYGLTANIVQIVDKYVTSGDFGGQGVPQTTDAATLKANSGTGNHLDVMDCTVCHVQKETMMVRTLDATSGMRFPSVLGTDPNKGMFGLFEDPATTPLNNYAAGQFNAMYTALGMGAPFQPDANGKMISQMDGAPAIGSKLQPWTPLHTWQKFGNMDLPLTTPDIFSPGIHTDTKAGLKFRRKIYLSNPIVAAIWNNTDSNVDANGDGATGGILNNDKPSLVGYEDIFTGALLDKNNTQGFDEPIFDPWIMRDLKAGFTFGPAPLSVISVGFGSNPAYASAYDQQGLFTGAYKYVSVWSGAVVLTEPDQIAEYKAYRNSIKNATVNGQPSGDGKSWTGTELALVGDPFTVTHGIAPVAKHVLGKSCADCHAPGASFFNGDFTMTGTAIPADRTYDPSAMLATTGTGSGMQFVPAWMYDANAYLPVLDEHGDPIRMAGLGGAFATASDMMSRPLEPYRVKGYKGDLRTNFEGFNKLGQPRTSEFQEDTACSATDSRICTHTVPLQRADALYPHEKNEDGSELKIYCKVSDDCATDPSKLMNGRAFADYLESAYVADKANFGIGETFAADIATVNGVAANEGTSVVTVSKGVSAPIVAATSGTSTGYTYSWTINDGSTVSQDGNPVASTIPAGKTTSYDFPKTGIFNLTLTVTNSAGKVSTKTQKVSVIEPQPVTFTVGAISTTGGVTTVPFTTVNGNGFTKYVVSWGDGSPSTTVNSGTFADLSHRYLRFTKYRNAQTGLYSYNTSIKFFNGTALLATKNIAVTP